MGKVAKRSRKFQAKGGIKGALQKGRSFTKKGKLAHRSSKKSTDDTNSNAEEAALIEAQAAAAAAQQERASDDFISGKQNISDLNMDDFFNTFDGEDESSSESDEESMDDEENKENDVKEESSDSEDSSAEDDSVAEKKHAQEMDELKSTDPEFYKYLKDNEASLLEFGKDDLEGTDDEIEDTDGGKKISVSEEADMKEEKSSTVPVLTKELLDKFERSAFVAHGIKGLRNLVSAYRTACHLSDPNINSEHGISYQIEDSDVYDRLMLLVLGRVHDEFRHHLLDSNKSNSDEPETDVENEPINPRVMVKARRWPEMKKMLEVFFRSTTYLLSEAKEPQLLRFILKSIGKFLPFATPFPKVSKALLKQFILLWRAPFDNQDGYQIVRLQSFIRIRQLALTQPFPFIEDCLKSLYLAYAKSAKFSSEAALATLTFMGNCVVELYSLDIDLSYQHAFVYIRQLALHLRTAISKKTKESFQIIYSWQYLNCLKVWTAVLAANPGESDGLKSLIYPITEIILGVTKLLPNVRHLPIRLHCVRLLQQLAACSETFIPTTSVLLDVLELKEISMKPKKGASNVQGIRLPLLIKLPKNDPLRTMDQLDACIRETFVLLNREMDLYRFSAGFPEFTYRICQRLRKFAKETRVHRWKAYAKGCIDFCEQNASKAIQDRSALEVVPKDVKKLEILKPANVPTMKERYDNALSKEKRMIAVTTPKMNTTPQSSEGKKKSNGAKKRKLQEKTAEKSTSKGQSGTKSSLREIGEDTIETLKDDVVEGIEWSDDED